MVILIMMLAILSVMIEVLETVGMMRAMFVVMMKVVIAKVKDKDGERKFDCGDSNIDDGADDGRVNINGADDARNDGDSKDDIGFEGNDE